MRESKVRRCRGALVAILLITLSAACSVSKPVLYGVGGFGAGAALTWIATAGLDNGGQCGDLQQLVVRHIDAGWDFSNFVQQLRAEVELGDRPVVADLQAADVHFYNTLSIICELRRRNPPLADDVATRWLEIASAKRMIAEAVTDVEAAPGYRGISDILKELPFVRRADLEAFHAQTVAAARENPEQAWAHAETAAAELPELLLVQLTMYLDQLTAGDNIISPMIQVLTADVRLLSDRLAQAELRLAAVIQEGVSGLETATLQEISGLHGRRNLQIVDSASVYFAFDEATLPDSEKSRFAAWAEGFADPRYLFSVIGYADRVGSADYNIDLSRRRAAEIERVLVQRVGIPPVRLAAAGVGEYDAPGAETNNPRRVIVLVHAAPVPGR